MGAPEEQLPAGDLPFTDPFAHKTRGPGLQEVMKDDQIRLKILEVARERLPGLDPFFPGKTVKLPAQEGNPVNAALRIVAHLGVAADEVRVCPAKRLPELWIDVRGVRVRSPGFQVVQERLDDPTGPGSQGFGHEELSPSSLGNEEPVVGGLFKGSKDGGDFLSRQGLHQKVPFEAVGEGMDGNETLIVRHVA